MCQLTFIDTNSKVDHKLNILIGLLLHNNANANNKDGWGLYTLNGKKFIKSENSASDDPAFYKTLSELDLRSVMAHVRMASTIYKDASNVCERNAHPFKKKNLVGIHNGTLYRKKGKAVKNVLDSEDFMNELSAEMGQGTQTPDAIQKVYSTFFHGKFAFMISDRRDGEFYIARGRTAPLHKIELEFSNGDKVFIVNTAQDTLAAAVNLYSRLSLMLGGDSFTHTTIELLPADTIMWYDREDMTLNAVLSNPQTEKPPEVSVHQAWNSGRGGVVTYSRNTQALNGRLFSAGRSIIQNTAMETLEEAMYLMKWLFDIDLGESKGLEFSKANLTKLEGEVAKTTFSKNSLWTDILSIVPVNLNVLDLYKELNLTFPYWANELKDLELAKEALDEIYLNK